MTGRELLDALKSMTPDERQELVRFVMGLELPETIIESSGLTVFGPPESAFVEWNRPGPWPVRHLPGQPVPEEPTSEA